MLQLAILLISLGLLGALFGYGFVAGTAVGVAKVLFLVFVCLAVLTLLRVVTYRPTV